MHRVCLVLLVLVSHRVASCDEATHQQVRDWIQQLQSERFQVREHATKNLVQAGPAAIASLREHVLLGGVESATRGLAVLRELALSNQVAAQDAEAVIREVAAGRATSSAQHALTVLESLHGIRTAYAIKILKRQGATVASSISEYDERRSLGGAGLYVTLGKSWRGTINDLEYLDWITDADRLHITFEGADFGDAWLRQVSRFDRIVSLQLNRSGVTDDGLKHLVGMKNLRALVLRYNDVSDACLDHIATTIRSSDLETLSVFGTRMTKVALDKLAADHAGLTLRYRRGGFLGVSGSGITGMGCYISTVTPNHAAARAGIRPGDVVLTYDGTEVTAFSRNIPPRDDNDGKPTLAELIGQHPAGTEVAITIRRGHETLEKKVVLGEWP